MRPTTAAFDAAVKQPHESVSRVSLLRPDLTVDEILTGEDGIAIDGSVSTDPARRRTCQLSLANPAGDWTPGTPGDPFYPNRIIAVERGIVVDGAPEYASLGIFLIDNPIVTVTAAGATLAVSGQDRVKLAAKSRFTKPETYWAGTPLATVVRAIAQGAGMGDALYRLDDAGKFLAADRTFDVGIDRWPSLIALAAAYALTVYVDADGYTVLEPAIAAATLPDPTWTFEGGPDAIMLGVTKGLTDDRLFNHTLVSAEGSNLRPISAEARDLNPASPAYNPIDGTGPIGDRLYVLASAMIRSEEQAQDVADALLLEVALVEESVTVPSAVHPGIEGGDVVHVIEPLSGTDDSYIVDTLSVPLGVTAAMTLTSRKVRSLVP